MSHLKRTTRIHAPVDRVYHVAHDPGHWSDWYVGVSDEVDLESAGGPRHRYIMVGNPFPLTQRVQEDRIEAKEAHWHARPEGAPEAIDITDCCKILMLSSEQDWSYVAKNGETEVTVTIDFTVPSSLLEKAEDRTLIERLEAACLDRTLENLRRLCETTH